MHFFSGGKSNTVRDSHIKMLSQWKDANSMKSDKSQWSVRFKTRTDLFVFFIILPPDFPEVAPVFKFQSPVDHPWVSSHDGLTILNENLLQWSPHCDITGIGKVCVHEFSINPPKPLIKRSHSEQLLAENRPRKTSAHTTSSEGSRLATVYRSKPFGIKLSPRNKLKKLGAVVHGLENFHPKNGLTNGMWLVTIGQRDVENFKFDHIIKLLSEVSVPVKLVFDGLPAAVLNQGWVVLPPTKAQSWSEPKPAERQPAAYNANGASYNVARTSFGYGMPVYKQQEQHAIPVLAASANQIPGKPQQLPQPKYTIIEEKPPTIEESTFNVLDTYSINKLKELIGDDMALEQLALDVADKDLNRKRKRLREETKAAANKNLSCKESIEATRTELEQLRKDVAELQDTNRTLYAEKQRLVPTIDVLQVRKALEAEAQKADQEAQELVDKFESDDIAYVTFIKKYKASRESHHHYLITKGLIS